MRASHKTASAGDAFTPSIAGVGVHNLSGEAKEVGANLHIWHNLMGPCIERRIPALSPARRLVG